jgi:hypothetical protein
MTGAEDRKAAADAARDTAVRTTVGMLVQLGLLVGFSLAVSHREQVTAYGRHALKRFRARGDVDELAVMEFNARVSGYSHGEGQR